ncbi:MAG TPA: glycine/sarcosine/betaine reductase complex component C subunit beta [Acidimicrobiia bacterium]|nr:glycine/sarcosine/betaine reductase complex component C subunit beta [Acidimicrobiia bacterium]
MTQPAILASHYVLAHGPDFVRYGSKPTRELAADPALLPQLEAALRSWDQVVAYPPNQTFIGNLTPDELAAIPRPWTAHPMAGASPVGKFGQMVPQAALYALMKLCDEFDLIVIDAALAAEGRTALEGVFPHRLDRVIGVEAAEVAALVAAGGGMPLYHRGRMAGFFRTAHDEDPSLAAHVLFENLACKATAVLAVAGVLTARGLDPSEVDYLLNTGEEAVGDRYQRGGGSLSKAVGEVVGTINATGSDIKAFCSAPVHALIIAGAMVAAGLHRYVVVLGGGSQAKLGMKFRAHLRNGVAVMEDCLGGMAFVVGPDDGTGMRLRLDLTGKHPIGAGSSPQAIYQALVFDPLERAGLKLADVDRYAVEMHNPEITEPGDGGDVPRTNYRTLAAMAVRRGEIERAEMDEFTARHGMPGFAPTQGHIPAGVPYLGHAHAAMIRGELRRAMIVAKGSLFLGRMTQLVDGVSIVVEGGPSSEEGR